jgi:hypothetical protein
MSTHEGHIGDIGRLVRVESCDLRFHPLAAVAALPAPCVSSDHWRFRAGRASPGDAAGGFGRPIRSTTQTAGPPRLTGRNDTSMDDEGCATGAGWVLRIRDRFGVGFYSQGAYVLRAYGP